MTESLTAVVDWMTDIFNEYPMLWSLYGIMLVIPFVLLAACCVSPKTPTNNQRFNRKEEQKENIPTGRQDNRESSEGGARYRKRRAGKQTIEDANVNGMRELTDDTGPDEAPREEEQQWNFPPTLDDFNLMECEEDPARLEEIFADKRLVEVKVRLSQSQGLGLTIVGGRGSQNGDVPIYVKRILPSSVLETDGKLKSGDELVAVNEILLVNVTKEYASNVLSNVQDRVRLLVLQDL